VALPVVIKIVPLVLVSNQEEDPFVHVHVMHQALEVALAVQFRERNRTNKKWKENRD
jgi:hypothetical protein